jgi:hypothetical protein
MEGFEEASLLALFARLSVVFWLRRCRTEPADSQ